MDNARILHKDSAYCVVSETGERLFCDTLDQALQVAVGDFMAFVYQGDKRLYAAHNGEVYYIGDDVASKHYCAWCGEAYSRVVDITEDICCTECYQKQQAKPAEGDPDAS